jgi:lysophospholipase L1-like esterase
MDWMDTLPNEPQESQRSGFHRTIISSKEIEVLKRGWFRHVAHLIALSLLPMMAAAQNFRVQDFALKDGETVVFYGDSITAQRLYTRFAEEFVLTRYPNLHVQFVNAGVPGDTTYGGYAGAMKERVQRDVAPFHPDMITVMLGMNDGGYVPESAKIDAVFRKGYSDLLDELERNNPDAALTIILPTPYDETTHGTDFPGYSSVIDQNAKDVAEIAARRRVFNDRPIKLVDFHGALVDALERAKAQFPQLAPLLIPDRIHPADTGHWVMASTLLSAWNVTPIVSELSLSAEKAYVIDKQRTTVSELEKTATGVRWTQLDEALPLPLDFNNALTKVLLGVFDIAKLDEQTLRAEGLAPGQYQLWIDGKMIATFSQDELRRGVNLALLKTPMLDQARGIDWYEERRATLDQARFILSAETAQKPDPAEAEARLRAAGDELAATIRTKLTPKPHHFELRRE